MGIGPLVAGQPVGWDGVNGDLRSLGALLPTVLGSGSTAVTPLSEVILLTFTPAAGQSYSFSIGYTGTGGAAYVVTNASGDTTADFNVYFRHKGNLGGTDVEFVIDSVFAATRTFNWKVFGWT